MPPSATLPPNSDSVLDAALRYVQFGWPLIDGLYGVGPRDPNWPARPPITTEPRARAAFDGEPRQVSLWTGLPGSNLVDVDLDCVEAVQLAPHYLTETHAIWGRPGNPLSHFLYRVTPTSVPTKLVKLTGPDQRVLLEVRGRASNGISALPPSLHKKSGELYCWYADGEPAEITWDDLLTQAKTLAAAALVFRVYPREPGGRNEFAKPLAGLLAHAGWPQDQVVRFMRPILEAAHDDVVERLRDAVVHTVRQHQRGQHVTGAPSLATLLGETVVVRVRDWLGLGQPTATSRTAPDELPLTSMAQLLSEPEEAQTWLVDDLLPAGGLGLLVGKPKAGKTVTAQNLAFAVARGEPFLGRATRQGPVYYLALEEKRSEFTRRFKAMGATDEPIYAVTAAVPQDGIGKLRRAIERAPERPVLAIVDPLLKFTRVKDADAYAELTNALEPLLMLARETEVTVLATHHAGKADRTGGDEVLGSTAIFGAVDTLLGQRRWPGKAGEVKYRTLYSVQRYGTDLPETVIDRNPVSGLLSLAGSRASVDDRTVTTAILGVLAAATGPLTEPDVSDLAEGETGRKREALRRLVREGRIVRTGKGAKGDPFRYALLQARGQADENPRIAPSPEPPILSFSSGFTAVGQDKNRESEETPRQDARNACLGTSDENPRPGERQDENPGARHSRVQAAIDLFDGEVVRHPQEKPHAA